LLDRAGIPERPDRVYGFKKAKVEHKDLGSFKGMVSDKQRDKSVVKQVDGWGRCLVFLCLRAVVILFVCLFAFFFYFGYICLWVTSLLFWIANCVDCSDYDEDDTSFRLIWRKDGKERPAVRF
jgi:hypothetical protein